MYIEPKMNAATDTAPMQPSAIMTRAKILTISAVGDTNNEPVPSDFDESVRRYAVVWGEKSAAAYRRRMLESFKISRALGRATVATQAWRAALAYGNGYADLFAACWAELVRLTRSTEIALGCLNSYRAAHVITYHPNYRSIELEQVERLITDAGSSAAA
jgi:5-formyltetrahydrofolate cyclo-ligase